MGLNAAALNIGANAIVAAITHASLHTNVIGSGSGGEVTGGAPAYARKAVTWGAAAAGVAALVATFPVFDVPAGTVARVGFFSAITAGTYYGDAEITDEVYGGQGTYTITAGSVTLT